MQRTTVLTLREEASWRALADSFPRPDLAQTPRFSRVYQHKGDGRAECFVYQDDDGRVLYPYIRRDLRALPFYTRDLGGCADIWTPYCYGGFVHDAPAARAPHLLASFRRSFEDFARETRIVSEFVRFHPLLQNQEGVAPHFDRLRLHRDNVVIDLALDERQLLAGCRASYQHCIRKARQAGLELKVERPEGAARFADLYRRTMERHRQTGYLRFDLEYFERLFAELSQDMELASVCHRGRTVAMALFLKGADYLDYFLCGSEADGFPLHPNHFMLFEMALWAKARSYRLLHLGGGRDSLYFFKRGFSRQTRPFFTAAKVHHPELYRELARRRHSALPPPGAAADGFFPTHRAGLE